MDALRTDDLRLLTSSRQGPCVCIFLPTHVAGAEGQQDAPRLNNLLNQAEKQLVAGGLPPTSARDLLKAARQLPNDAAYWQERSHGLAVYIAPEISRSYRLPEAFEELLFVGSRFLIRPLLPLLGDTKRFFILALSQNKPQFLQADQHDIAPVAIPNLPGSMEEALHYTDADRGSQVHAAATGQRGKQAAVFQGQGGQADARKDDIVNYFRMVDAALQSWLGKERAPLLLAGVEYLLPIYRSVNHYPHIAEAQLVGNCDHLSLHKILEQAKPLIKPELGRECRERAARFEQALGTEKAKRDMREILAAAQAGRAEALFLERRAGQWGIPNEDLEKIVLHEKRQEGDDDLLDRSAVDTMNQGGAVYVLETEEMPGDSRVAAALLRY